MLARGWVVLGLVWTVAARAEPAEWLVQMSQAVRTTNYEGIIVYRGLNALETFRVTHRYQDGEERERIQSLTGEPREILRIGDTVTCLLPRNRRSGAERHVAPQSLFPVLTPAQVQRISEAYELSDLGEQRIAGRRCRGVAIQPRDRLRYGYRIWADAETLVPIKVTLRDERGENVEQMMFTEVRFPTRIPDAAFEVSKDIGLELEAVVQERVPPSASARIGELLASAPVPAVQNRWRLSGLPPGFDVVMQTQRELPDGEGQLLHWIVSDGLSAVSVFGRDGAGAEGPADPFSSMGLLNAYRRMLGPLQVTVVGEVPRDTVRRIAEGLEDAGPAPTAQAAKP